jgi:putative ABC transport system ATP-binding protein
LPCRFSPLKKKRSAQRSSTYKDEALRLLEHLEMSDPETIRKPVTELSVGQQQRVAAARALIGAPDILVADEPTSSLDMGLRESFIRMLFGECEQRDTTLVFVSHDTSLAKLFDRTIQLNEINNA